MSITTGQNVEASDFINESERNATPSNDAGRVPKLESDGRVNPFFTRLGTKELNAGETLNGGTLPVPVYQNKTDNELYACDANDATKYKFIGFVTSNSTDGNAITFQGAGVVSGFSGLAEGEKYYVQDTVGTIGTSPGTQAILVGVAISTTQLLIQKGTIRAAGMVNDPGTASGSHAITCGFRPSVVRLYGKSNGGGGDNHSAFIGIWINGTMYATSAFHASTNGGASNTARLNEGSGNSMTFSIGTITDTGFTVSWSESGSYDMTDFIVWEAEGEL